MTHLCHSFPVMIDLFGHSTLLLAWLTLFGLFTQVLTSYDLFGLLTQVTSLKNWFESANDSSSIWETWIDSTPDSSSFPINWLRINSWLMWIARYWFRLAHDSKCFPFIPFNSWLKQNTFDFLSQLMIWLWLIPMSASNRSIAPQ